MDKRNKRTKRSGIVAVGMAAVLAVGGIFAFMSDHDNAINKFNFTNENGDSSIDIQLSETEWVEENGVDIQYGTPVAKNPVATNIGTNDMYAFATVILPAKGVTVQNALGQIVDENNKTLATILAEKQAENPAATMTDVLTELGIQRTIANNVSKADKTVFENADGDSIEDKTEILGVFKDPDLTDEYDFGEVIPDGETIYFKLSSTAPLGTAVDGQDYKVLEDTVDVDNFTSNILGHQFMLKYEADDSGNIAVRELYALETGAGMTATTSKEDAANYAGRVVNNTINDTDTPENEGTWIEADDADVDNGGTDKLDDKSDALFTQHGENKVYGRYDYNKADTGAGWIEITDKLDNNTIYIDGAGRIYSAHVFYYSEVLQPGQSTIPVFDAVELINVTDGQIKEQDDMDIYVETYGVQVSGLGDALKALEGNADATQADEGKIIWDVMANSTDDIGFDIFGVVKDVQDDTVADYLNPETHGGVQNVDNGYVPAP